jgi:hypothetical protein
MAEAIAKGETEAKEYAQGTDSEYLDFCQAFELSDEIAASGVEVFSLLRDSELDPTAYINVFFDTDAEHER